MWVPVAVRQVSCELSYIRILYFTLNSKVYENQFAYKWSWYRRIGHSLICTPAFNYVSTLLGVTTTRCRSWKIKFVGCVTSMQIVVSVDFYMGKFLWSEEVRGMLKEQKIQCSGKKSCTLTRTIYLKTTENMLFVFTCQLCFVTGSIVRNAKCRYLVLAGGGAISMFFFAHRGDTCTNEGEILMWKVNQKSTLPCQISPPSANGWAWGQKTENCVKFLPNFRIQMPLAGISLAQLLRNSHVRSCIKI